MIPSLSKIRHLTTRRVTIPVVSLLASIATVECVAQESPVGGDSAVGQTIVPVSRDLRVFHPLYGASFEARTAAMIEGPIPVRALSLDLGGSFDIVRIESSDSGIDADVQRRVYSLGVDLLARVYRHFSLNPGIYRLNTYAGLNLGFAGADDGVPVSQARLRGGVVYPTFLGGKRLYDSLSEEAGATGSSESLGWMIDLDVSPFQRHRIYATSGPHAERAEPIIRWSLGARVGRPWWIDRIMASVGVGGEARWYSKSDNIVTRLGLEVRWLPGWSVPIDLSAVAGYKFGSPFGSGLFIDVFLRSNRSNPIDLAGGFGVAVGWEW